MITEYAISLPFALTPYGTIGDTSDQRKIWSDRVLDVVGTAVGERVFEYNFGSKVHLEQWNTQDAATEGIKNAVSSAFISFLPLLKLVAVDCTYDTAVNQLNVDIKYKLPNEDGAEVTIGKVFLLGSTPLFEEI